jgi:putative membrane protein
MNAEHFLSKEERESVENAVAEAEKKTSAEIVCAVATESGRYDRAESIVGLAVGLIFLSMANAVIPGMSLTEGSWTVQQGIPLGWQALMLVMGFIAGSGLATYWHPLRRMFVSEQEIEEEVSRASAYVFSLGKLTGTRERSGVLIYVSLFERRVMILADRRAFEVLGQDEINGLRDLAVKRLREKKRRETFVDTIASAAEKLCEKLPAGADNSDELSNRLMLLHPRP